MKKDIPLRDLIEKGQSMLVPPGKVTGITVISRRRGDIGFRVTAADAGPAAPDAQGDAKVEAMNEAITQLATMLTGMNMLNETAFKSTEEPVMKKAATLTAAIKDLLDYIVSRVEEGKLQQKGKDDGKAKGKNN